MTREAAMHDPFDLEIVREHLGAATEEMFATTLRTSQSTTIYEVLDFAVGITDERGRLIAQGAGMAILLAIFGEQVGEMLRHFPLEELEEGDILMTNDPYAPGGTHLSDFTLVMPVFHEGEVVAFTANKAHYLDVGGKEPGSVPVDATEIFQEGFRLPPVKVFRAGVLDDTVVRTIMANTRAPSAAAGDLHAQAASVRTGARRVQEICRHYGVDTYRASIERLIVETDERARSALAEMPRGSWQAEQTIEIAGQTARACVTVTIDDDGMTCDFTGTDPQIAQATMNCAGSGLLQACSAVFQAAVGPDVPINAGTYQALKVICPPGTLLTAGPPAALSLYFQAIAIAADLVWRALSPAVPGRLPAGHFLFGGIMVLAGPADGPGGVFVMVEPNPGGWGAGEGADGERALVSMHGGDTLNIPVEVVEQRYPVVIERYAFDTSPGGAGRWRGGEGIVRDCRILTDWAMATPMGDHRRAPTWGAAGGQDGTFNRTEVVRADGTTEVHVPSVRLMLGKGDLIRIVTGKGGGWGDPRERDPELVRRDVRDGFVSSQEAEEVYGVSVGAP